MLIIGASQHSSESVTLIPATQLSYKRLAHLINQAFADYFLTVWLDEYQFERMCYEEDILLEKSVVA
ncbi:MAG: hypothetical protein P1S60_13445, partial [Anaerolineae bacterium]|nr:hypothetical protein [Anaerolineae bacterium]